jgi:hypothetical protein
MYKTQMALLLSSLLIASVVDPDPVGSSSFRRIQIGIQGLPIPDTYPFEPNVKLNYTFSRNLQYTVQNIENYDTI